MRRTVNLSFREGGKTCKYTCEGIELKNGDFVMANNAGSMDLGRVIGVPIDLDESLLAEDIEPVLRLATSKEIERGQVLAKPGTIHPHTKFVGQVYVLTEKEGGRQKPFFAGYRPQFFFRTTDVTGTLELPEDIKMVMPGDHVKITANLIVPIAMDEGLRFAIREGGRTVGAGVVSKIIE